MEGVAECDYFFRFELMKSSGRPRNLKYQRKVSISPKKGMPIVPGGNFPPPRMDRSLTGRT